MEEGRKRKRKVWEREKYKTSERQKLGDSQDGLWLDQMQRTMGPMKLGSQKGRRRETT